MVVALCAAGFHDGGYSFTPYAFALHKQLEVLLNTPVSSSRPPPPSNADEEAVGGAVVVGGGGDAATADGDAGGTVATAPDVPDQPLGATATAPDSDVAQVAICCDYEGANGVTAM